MRRGWWRRAPPASRYPRSTRRRGSTPTSRWRSGRSARRNVLARLPGTNPALAAQTVVLSAHLDGYGPGEPVAGDALYNGTLDDAAYVALLIRLAERRAGKGFARPVLFAAFTGEEKGLLGARWFVAHPTLPQRRISPPTSTSTSSARSSRCGC